MSASPKTSKPNRKESQPTNEKRRRNPPTNEATAATARAGTGTPFPKSESPSETDDEWNYSNLQWVASFIDNMGTCTNWKLFRTLLATRLVVLLIVVCIFDVAVEDYDTSTYLLPSVLGGSGDKGSQKSDEGRQVMRRRGGKSSSSLSANVVGFDSFITNNNGYDLYDYPTQRVLNGQERKRKAQQQTNATSAPTTGYEYEDDLARLESIYGPLTPTDYEGNYYWQGEPFRAFRSLRHWDGIHFQHISFYGYTHEHLFAFFPTLPMLLKGYGFVARYVDALLLEPLLEYVLPLPSTVVEVDSDVTAGVASSSASSSSSFTNLLTFLSPFIHININPSHYAFTYTYYAVIIRNAMRYLLEDLGAVILSVGAYAVGGVLLRTLTVLVYVEEGSDLRAVFEGPSVGGEGADEIRITSEPTIITKSSKSPDSSPATVLVVNRGRIIGTVMLTYLATPAGVFTLIPYTESLFAMCTFGGILVLKYATNLSDANVIAAVSHTSRSECGINTEKRSSKTATPAHPDTSATSRPIRRRYALAAILFLIGSTIRSNGMLMVGYFGHELLFHRWRVHRKLQCIIASREEAEKRNTMRKLAGSMDAAQHQQQEEKICLPSPTSATLSGQWSLTSRVITCFLCIFISTIPYALVNYIGWQTYCGDGWWSDAERRNASPSSTSIYSSSSSAVPSAYHVLSDTPENKALLDSWFALIRTGGRRSGSDADGAHNSCPPHWWQFYGYIQRKYWNVYPFSAYTLKNMPNFLIPLPMVVFIVIALVKYWRVDDDDDDGTTTTTTTSNKREQRSSTKTAKRQVPITTTTSAHSFSSTVYLRLTSMLLNPHLLCLLLMIMFASVVMHIQVMVRFVFASPAYYWLLSALMIKGGYYTSATYLIYGMTWLLTGCVAFTSHLPWT